MLFSMVYLIFRYIVLLNNGKAPKLIMLDNTMNTPNIKGGCTIPINIRLRIVTIMNGNHVLFLLTLHLNVTLLHL